ncbi:hypothetical protein A4G19_07005 [Pasteurellaceae bacterium Macca]|nr:hypothetical protein [Pasteurellaceae bacterium Macca]
MRWFLSAFKNIFNYSGRARRAEYGWFFLTNFLIQMGVLLVIMLFFAGAFLGGVAQQGDEVSALAVGSSLVALILNLLLSLYGFIVTLVTLSLTVRRLHDLGWSGWWLLVIILAPILAMIPFVVVGLNQSQMSLDASAFVIPTLIFGAVMIALLVVQCLLFFKDGQRFDNQYGVDPKAVSTENSMTVTA